MWKEINTANDLSCFLDEMCFFHDSCIKEMKYLSGAYVEANLAMHPLNDRRVLRVIIQRQFEDNSMIEMEFLGLKKLNLFPVSEKYTCEILDATMIMKDGDIYWCDCGDLLESDLDNYNGTLICASALRWRTIDNHMGEKDFYHSDM